MDLPRFTAEASLSKNGRAYRILADYNRNDSSVHPSLFHSCGVGVCVMTFLPPTTSWPGVGGLVPV
jgi:hypothetical protein